MTRKVMIGTPCYDGRCGVYYTVALFEIAEQAKERGIHVDIRFRAYDSIIERARNDLLRDARELDADDMVMIDDDQAFDPELFFRLLEHPVDLVGYPVRKKAAEERYNVKYLAALPLPRDAATGLLMVDGVGTGFLRFSRRAIDAAWEAGEPYTSDRGEESRWSFDIRPHDGTLWGEDIWIAEALKQAGIQCYVDDSATISHVGVKKWDGDFRAALDDLERKARGE